LALGTEDCWVFVVRPKLMGALYTATTVFISKDNPVKADHVVGRFLGVVKSWQASCATSRPIIYTAPDECQPKS
jgi:hypothetical protein